MKAKTYRKTATVEAIQWDGTKVHVKEIEREFNCTMYFYPDSQTLDIETEEGDMLAYPNDYICKGIDGECWPVRKDIFERTYVEINDDDDFGDCIESCHNIIFGG